MHANHTYKFCFVLFTTEYYTSDCVRARAGQPELGSGKPPRTSVDHTVLPSEETATPHMLSTRRVGSGGNRPPKKTHMHQRLQTTQSSELLSTRARQFLFHVAEHAVPLACTTHSR